MKLRLKEDPKEWRKQALLTALGLALASSLLRWRRVLAPHPWLAVLVFAAAFAAASIVKPIWFRGYYRLAMRFGYFFSQIFGFVALVVFFLFILTPVGLILRLAGKDPLQLKRPLKATTYWQPAREPNPLDRLF
jgi:hypothetical protein